MAHKLIQTYVKEMFFISTVKRRSSCSECPGWFFETIVWKWDKETGKRGKIIAMEDSGDTECSALNAHSDICYRYATEGYKKY